MANVVQWHNKKAGKKCQHQGQGLRVSGSGSQIQGLRVSGSGSQGLRGPEWCQQKMMPAAIFLIGSRYSQQYSQCYSHISFTGSLEKVFWVDEMKRRWVDEREVGG